MFWKSQRLQRLAVIFLAACMAPAAMAQSPEPDVEHGKVLAVQNCSFCHSVYLDGESTHPKAPPFWSMSARRDVSTIAEFLIKKASPKHSDMPTFQLNEQQAVDIAAWIAYVQPIAHGQRIVEEYCASCHAVGRTGVSPHPDAPAFRLLGYRYPVEALEEAFAEGIETGHPDMPRFEVNIVQLQDILAYIQSIQELQ